MSGAKLTRLFLISYRIIVYEVFKMVLPIVLPIFLSLGYSTGHERVRFMPV